MRHRTRWASGEANASHDAVRRAAFVVLELCETDRLYVFEVDPADADEWQGLACPTCGDDLRVPPPGRLLDD